MWSSGRGFDIHGTEHRTTQVLGEAWVRGLANREIVCVGRSDDPADRTGLWSAWSGDLDPPMFDEHSAEHLRSHVEVTTTEMSLQSAQRYVVMVGKERFASAPVDPEATVEATVDSHDFACQSEMADLNRTAPAET